MMALDNYALFILVRQPTSEDWQVKKQAVNTTKQQYRLPSENGSS
jgi:hypothetical protein